jgi:hypothetical protein
MDWRPVLGFGLEDAGTPWERACALEVLERAREAYSEVGKRGEAW